jgi:hypothetical protein
VKRVYKNKNPGLKLPGALIRVHLPIQVSGVEGMLQEIFKRNG